ncbi:type 2 periplasmic-binding domain-containing protein [Mycoplasmopsis cricetuli]|uniref:hypothetical protein n=1 Tax=Mycoplasmopsis cricetuli TaxID=171283 RepID=UPI000471B568|nr:hypothetical protein [Mycoplasmopsis cricetuli]
MKLAKKLLTITGLLLGFIGIGAIVVAKNHYQFKPSFLNYKSYMSKSNIKGISDTYEYKEFDSIQEFTRALTDNKTIAGIGSDFQIVELIKNNLLSKIDYSFLFEDETLKNNKLKTAKYLQMLFPKQLWDHLTQYDEFLKYDSKGQEVNLHLWEYYLPYFMQDVVFAYNKKKNKVKSENSLENGLINFEKYYPKYKNNLYETISILKILAKNGFNNFNITDAIRDNMVYGSTYWNVPEEDGDARENLHSGAVTDETYATLIDSFVDLIEQGTGKKISDPSIHLIADGLKIVENVVHPLSKTNVAIMYNGDALDAYYASDNVDDENVEDGMIGIVRSNSNLLLTDGFVISAKSTEFKTKEILSVVKKNIFQSLIKDFKNIQKVENENVKLNLDKDQIKNLAIEKSINYTWRELQKIYFKNLLNQNFDSEFDSIAQFIDLSRMENRKKFLNYYNSLNDIEINNNFKINPYPTYVYQYLEKYNLKLNNISNKIFEIIQNKKTILSKLIKQLNEKNKKLNKEENDILNKLILELNELIEEYFKNNNILEKDNLIFQILAADFKTWTQKEYFYFSDVINSSNTIANYLKNFIAKKIAIVNIDADELTEEISINWKNLENFSFISYTPTAVTDYIFIKRNYFNDLFNDNDLIAIDIYDIFSKKEIKRVSILPISQRLSSLVEKYYYRKTRS